LRQKHQIHNSQHHVAKVKAKNGGSWEENTSKVCLQFGPYFPGKIGFVSTN